VKKALLFVVAAFVTLSPVQAQKKVMLMNRLGPTESVLYIANPDGTGERPLMAAAGFDYNASFSPDGKWVVFTSERNGFGEADIYRVHPDGSGLERLTDDPAMDDQGVLSPDGTELAFVSTRNSPLHTANIWILDLKTKHLRNLTGGTELQAATPGEPDAFLRPAWSPDGKWIAFSSDRNTEWKGAEQGAGAGHWQFLSIYLIQPDGKGLRRLTSPDVAAGSPKWSADGKRIVCYEINPKDTFGARMFAYPAVTSQVASFDVVSGAAKEETSGPGLKVSPQYLSDGRIGFLVKGKILPPAYAAGPPPAQGTANPGGSASPAPAPGVYYTSGGEGFTGNERNPAWSPDGKQVLYQKVGFTARAQNQLLYSWDPQREYRYTDVFPAFSRDGKLAITDLKNLAKPQSSLSVMDPDGSNRKTVFDDPSGSAMMPSWSPDGTQMVFGFGGFFAARSARPARLMIVNADGSGAKDLTGTTEGEPNTGFPSWSPDGRMIVYRVWGKGVRGLRLMNLADRSVKILTEDWDNFPFWSPSGDRILFTRQKDLDFDVFVMSPDGTNLKQLTHSPGSDGHATWMADGKAIFFSSSRAGFKEEASLYDNSPQPYAQIFVMNADGSDQRQITDSRWEDSMAVYTPEAAHNRSSSAKQ
jgi:Tol biopolymer transport system component